MDASLDVFAMLGEGDFLWIGCARTDDEAVELMRTQELTKADTFFTHSQITGCKTFYSVGQESDVIRLPQPPAGMVSSAD